jgi:hypothetical protein
MAPETGRSTDCLSAYCCSLGATGVSNRMNRYIPGSTNPTMSHDLAQPLIQLPLPLTLPRSLTTHRHP